MAKQKEKQKHDWDKTSTSFAACKRCGCIRHKKRSSTYYHAKGEEPTRDNPECK